MTSCLSKAKAGPDSGHRGQDLCSLNPLELILFPKKVNSVIVKVVRLIAKKGPVYLAFGTRRRQEDGEGNPEKSVLRAPWEVYLVSYVDKNSIGCPPYYQITGIIDGEPLLEKLVEDSYSFRKVDKWVGAVIKDRKRHSAQRMVLQSLNPSCVVDRETAMQLVRVTEEYRRITSLPEEEAELEVLKSYLALLDE
jgi:hypothetical protein